MRLSYIFIHEDAFGSTADIIKYIDDIPEILNWSTELPNSIYLVSELTAKQLFDKIKPFSEKGKFLITETTKNKQGWISKKSWAMMNDKHLPGEESD